MKIAIVIGTLGRGGTERQVAELVCAAHPSHARCVVICLGKEGPLAVPIRASGARVIALGGERFGSPSVLIGLARTLRKERPDVVYGMLFWGYTLALPLAAVFSRGACRVQGRRSLPDVDVPRRRLHRPLRALANRLTHGVVANSIGVGSAVAAAETTLAGRIWVVPNGVAAVAQSRRTTQSRRVRIVCVANLIAYKGHATLIAALGRLAPAGWSACLIGDGPERARLEEAIAAHGLCERVTLLGAREDVQGRLAGADIAVLPSYSEGLPNAVMEAMAHGLPVVASDVGGVRSLLGSGAGLLVPPGDEAALAEALRLLIGDGRLRRRMGQTGRAMTQRALSVGAMRDSTLRAMTEIRGRGPVRLPSRRA